VWIGGARKAVFKGQVDTETLNAVRKKAMKLMGQP